MTNVSLIKYLHKKGYRPKLIQIITGYSQSVVSKGIHSERPYIPTINNINEEQAIRKYVIDRFLECRELLLMHMLKFVKRTTLESDYVSQEKKKKQV